MYSPMIIQWGQDTAASYGSTSHSRSSDIPNLSGTLEAEEYSSGLMLQLRVLCGVLPIRGKVRTGCVLPLRLIPQSHAETHEGGEKSDDRLEPFEFSVFEEHLSNERTLCQRLAPDTRSTLLNPFS